MPSRAERAPQSAAPPAPGDGGAGQRPDAAPGTGGGPPPAAGARVAAEWALRAVAAALVGWMLVRALGGAGAGPARMEVADQRTLPAALARWATVAAPVAAHVRLDSVPGAVPRDWLAALPGAGTRVTWSGTRLPPLAITAEPVADPAGATRVRVSAPAGLPIVLRDAVGVLDTVSVRRGEPGISLTVPAAVEGVDASAHGVGARAVVGGSRALRRVLVLGQVGWESRFVVDALEERGWRVDARLGLAPRNDIVSGIATGAPAGPGARDAIDTARYAAVVALDTSVAARAPRLGAYVRSGGGLVLAGSAGEVAAFRAMAPGAAGAVVHQRPLAPLDSSPAAARAALALVPIVALRPDAVPLDARGTVVAVAARRVGPGRVLQSGYADTWRWRMIAADGVRAHRDWWAGLVSDVAYAPLVPRGGVPRSDPAPLAALIGALGRPMPDAAARAAMAGRAGGVGGVGGVGGDAWRGLVFAAFVLAVLVETASRRTRGAR